MSPKTGRSAAEASRFNALCGIVSEVAMIVEQTESMPPPEPSQPLVVGLLRVETNSQIKGDITWAVADMLLHTRRSLFCLRHRSR